MMFVFAGWTAPIILGFVSQSLGSSKGADVGSGMKVQQVVQEQRMALPIPTVKSTITISYPKITDGPSLVRRKLGSTKWDAIHNGIRGQKRDMTSCPASFNLCPKSMKGGCCSEGLVCGTSSCFPKSVATGSACGKLDYHACGISEGGGCCPKDYQCGINGCIPLPGVDHIPTCSANYFLCPESLNYGCCKSGLGCKLDGCWTTSISTFSYTKTLTTTDESLKPHTLTTIIIATTILNAPNPTETVETGLRGKTFPSQTAIAKLEATGTKDSGLTKSEMGGIIGGAIAILGVILIAAFVIIKRLNRAIKVSEQANSHRHSSSSENRSRPSFPRRQNIDEMSVDPLMITPSQASGSIRRPYTSHNPSSTTNIEVELEDTASPPSFNTRSFSPRLSPYTHYQGGYNAVSSSESQYSSSSGGHRSLSLESSPPLQHNPNAGYFDGFVQSQSQPQHQQQTYPQTSHRNSQVSQISPLRPTHGRNWSDTSSISQTSSSLLSPAELDASADGEFRKPIIASFSRALQTFGRGSMSMIHRKKSDSVPLSPRSVGPRSLDWGPSPREGLLNIPEAGESRVALGDNNGNDHGNGDKQSKDVPLVGSEGTFGGGSIRGGMSDGSTMGNGTFGQGMTDTRLFGGRGQPYDVDERSRR